MDGERGPPAAGTEYSDCRGHQTRTPSRRSVPPNRRVRLPRCLKMMRAAAAIAAARVAADAPVAYAIDGNAMDARIDPREMYFVAHTATRNTRSEGGTATGVSTENTPHAVATPFPPRNFNHTG